MELIRLKDSESPHFDRAFRLYEKSFVYEERRDITEHRRVMKEDAYHCCVVTDSGVFIGIVFYWESDDFIYLEHLCVDEALRGSGYGSKILDMLKTYGKRIILEVEPIVDEITQKRIDFYERNDFELSIQKHIQPKYHKGDKDTVLWIMAQYCGLDRTEYEEFYKFLIENVQIKE